MTRRVTLPLFVLLAALHCVPFWSVHYLPLGDGPSHVYNAWILHGLATGTAPANIEQAYTIDWRPHPNWTGHAFMALAMAIVSPLVAEKLLVTLIFALLFAGAWRFTTAIDPRNDVYAFLVFPFTYTQTLMAGYYNFSLGIGLFLLILSLWWRRRDERRLSTVVVEALLLLLCTFTHPQATVLACAAIGFLSLMTRRWFHLLALIPVAPLLFLFGRTESAGAGLPLQPGIDWEAARILVRLEAMHSLGDGQLPLSVVVGLVFALLILVTLIRAERREANLLAVLALLFAAMMFWLPAPAVTRDLFAHRISAFVFLTLAGWFTPRAPRRLLLVALITIATANALINFAWIRRLATGLTANVRAFDAIAPETTLLPLLFTKARSDSMLDVYTHAMSYVALEKRLVDHGNYEVETHYFPIAARDDSIRASELEWSPAATDIVRLAASSETVVTRGLPPNAPQRRDLDNLYTLVQERGDVRIYRRKVRPRNEEVILLPLLGTKQSRGAPQGASWKVEQQIVNRGSAPARIQFHRCVSEVPCALTVDGPVSVTSNDAFAFLRVAPGTRLEVTTLVRRADVDRPDLSIVIPTIHQREFRSGGVRLERLAAGRKIGVRVYVISEHAAVPTVLRLRSSETGAVVSERTLEIAGYGMFSQADLRSEFGDLSSKASQIDIELSTPPGALVWAFATETDGEGRTRVVRPAS